MPSNPGRPTEPAGDKIELDRTPTGEEERDDDFASPEDREQRRRARRLHNDAFQDDIENKKTFSNHAYGITHTWVGFLIVITSAQFGLKPLGYGLGTTEFVTVVTSTTIAVLGFMVLVGRYLFPSYGDQRKQLPKEETKKGNADSGALGGK